MDNFRIKPHIPKEDYSEDPEGLYDDAYIDDIKDKKDEKKVADND